MTCKQGMRTHLLSESVHGLGRARWASVICVVELSERAKRAESDFVCVETYDEGLPTERCRERASTLPDLALTFCTLRSWREALSGWPVRVTQEVMLNCAAQNQASMYSSRSRSKRSRKRGQSLTRSTASAGSRINVESEYYDLQSRSLLEVGEMPDHCRHPSPLDHCHSRNHIPRDCSENLTHRYH